MGASTTLGHAMRRVGHARRIVCAAALTGLLSGAPALAAEERWALIVTGATGGEPYAAKYTAWRESLAATLRERFGYADERVLVLAERDAPGIRPATRENVRAVLADLRKRVSKDDVVLIMLVGHGTAADAEEAKFNLVGPDLSAREWADLIKPLEARVVFVNTTGGSFPFLQAVSGPGRVVVTATDSAQQQFETVFPDYFIRAFTAEGADLDRNGRVSMWEAFAFATSGVREWFEERGQLATERPLLDDTGDGIGREAAAEGPDGAMARVTYLQPDAAIAAATDAGLAALLKRRAELETAIELLKARKPAMPADEYERDLERALIELARVDRQIRQKS
jgi:hypothetical protein